MKHFTPAFTTFLSSLKTNNTTEWFNENRKTYEKEVKKPFADFVETMIAQIRKHEPDIEIKASDAITRINKDIRFSKDKTPYNTHVAANISRYGKKDKSYPGFYFQLSPESIEIYGGAYMIENDKLQEIRTLISKEPQKFAALYNDAGFTKKFGDIKGEQNKRIPPEFQKASEKEPLIANKQFYYTASLKSDLIVSEKLVDTLMEYYLAGFKVNQFLKEAWRKS